MGNYRRVKGHSDNPECAMPISGAGISVIPSMRKEGFVWSGSLGQASSRTESNLTTAPCCFSIQGKNETRENASWKDVEFQAYEDWFAKSWAVSVPQCPTTVSPGHWRLWPGEHLPTQAESQWWEICFVLGNGCILQILFIFHTHAYIQCHFYCFSPNPIFAMKLILSVAILPTVVFLKIWLGITALRFPQS